MTRIGGLVLCVALVVGMAACGDDDADEAGGGGDANTVAITERDYEFDVDGELRAGTVTIEVTNDGEELHEIAMGRLVGDATVDDVRSAFESAGPDDDDVLEGLVEEHSVIDDLGGVQQPGTSYAITGSGIEAGEYVLMCFISAEGGKPHAALGMVDGFTVAEGDGEAASPPDADVVVTATDDGLEAPERVDAGETTIEVVNDSSTNREVMLIKVKAGKSIDDVTAWFESGGEGAPDPSTSPLDFFAFVFDAEQDRRITVELTPGEWGIQAPDPEKPFEGPPERDPHLLFFTVE